LSGTLFGLGVVRAQEEANIVDTVARAGEFTVLSAALEASGLDETLAEAGPFTLFAPTDAAFSEVPTETRAALLADPSGALTTILLSHIVSGTVAAADISDGLTTTNLADRSLTFRVSGEEVEVNGATVITTDLAATNGIIHVIDAVLVPESVDLAALPTTPTAAITSTEEVTGAAEVTATTEMTAAEDVTATAEVTSVEAITAGEEITTTGELTTSGEVTASEVTTATNAPGAADEASAEAENEAGEAAPSGGLPWWVWLFPLALLFWLGWWWLNRPPTPPPPPPAH
jgi:uncharacterized surface protein with fasciclin (FAS1) repeats